MASLINSCRKKLIVNQKATPEKVSAKKFLFIIIGIVGAFIASGIDIQQISSTNINAGVYLAVFTGFLYAIYLFLKRTEKEGYNPIQALFNTFIFAVPLHIDSRAFSESFCGKLAHSRPCASQCIPVYLAITFRHFQHRDPI